MNSVEFFSVDVFFRNYFIYASFIIAAERGTRYEAPFHYLFDPFSKNERVSDIFSLFSEVSSKWNNLMSMEL